MSTATNKSRCITCGKDIKAAYKCEGCSQRFCLNHLNDHNREFKKQLDEIEDERNNFRQILSEQTKDLQKHHALFQQINQWEDKSILKIKQTANETRILLTQHTNEHIEIIENKLSQLTDELKELRTENDFNEININELKEKLIELEKELNQPSNITIKEDSSSFINKISVVISSPELIRSIISINTQWKHNEITVSGGNGQGKQLNQFDRPMSIYVDDKETIFVIDTYNHRIVEWKIHATHGLIVVGGNGQLSYPNNMIIDQKNNSLIISDRGNQRIVRYPRGNDTNGEIIISNVHCSGLAMDKNGYLYVSDTNKHEVRRWKIGKRNGTLVAGGKGQGSGLDQLSGPCYIHVDQDDSVYVSDKGNHRIMKWMKDAKEGIVVAGGQGQGNRVTQLSSPHGIIVDQLDTIYVADTGNDRVIRWLKEAEEGDVIVGGNGRGQQTNQLNSPVDLSFDRENNLYINDCNNYRVQKFQIDSSK